MAENKTEVIVVTKFEKSTTTPKRRAIEASDGRIFSYFHGDDGAPEWESLIRIDGAIEVTYFDKPNAKYPQHPYHNVVEVKAAEMPKEIAAPATSAPSGNGHGERYTDADREAFRRKDEMYARQTACNCVSQIVAARITANIQTAEDELWREVSQIEHYILTGEKPLQHVPLAEAAEILAVKSPTLAAVDAQFESSFPIPGISIPHTAEPLSDRKPSQALLAECAAYVRDMRKYGITVVMPPPGTTGIEVAEFAAGLRSRLAELKKNVDLGEEK